MAKRTGRARLSGSEIVPKTDLPGANGCGAPRTIKTGTNFQIQNPKTFSERHVCRFLGISNFHVKKDRKKIKSGQSLSPLLLIRDSTSGNVIIADGYHRLCAVYSFDGSSDSVQDCVDSTGRH